MNHDYRPKYEEMQDNQPGKPDEADNDRLYPNPGYSRQVGFILRNGDREAFNYSYLIRVRHLRDDNAIVMVFTSCTVKIEGYNLQPLYAELFDHRNRTIECMDERYKSLSDDTPMVTQISILENK